MCQADQAAAGQDSGSGPPRDAEPPNRRRSARYTVLDHRGWLGQWTDQGFDVFDVDLLDISRRGALFEIETRPTAIFRPPGPSNTP